ncbi:MAG: hypothetical protein VYE22_41045 [Myxococcota bacterium]|nr:hypothetical protein [Myxococcota bacterium]
MTPMELAEASDGLDAGDLVEAVRVMLRRRRRGLGGPFERAVVLAMMAALDLPLSSELERRAEGLGAVSRGVRTRAGYADAAPGLREIARVIEATQSLPLSARALEVRCSLAEMGASLDLDHLEALIGARQTLRAKVAAIGVAARLLPSGDPRRARDHVRRALAS